MVCTHSHTHIHTMAPLAFSDIAKSSNDLLNKDYYHLARAALEIKTKAPNGVAFVAKGKSSQKDGSIAGNLEAKYADKANGVTVTQGWTTANILDSKIEIDEALAQGLKGELATSFVPSSGAKNAKLSLFFKQPSFQARAFFDLLKGPTVTSDATLGHDGFIAGAEVGYDVSDAKVTKYSAAVGYTAPVYSTSILATNSLSVFSAAYFHRVNPVTEVGAKATWDSKAAAAPVGLEIGAKHILDANSFAKAKINNQGIAALAYSVGLKPGVRVGVGASIDTQRLEQSAHNLGVSFTFEG
ncbi:Mitochondrial outer membrane protein porin [Yarrowia sp. C11]|nr:Mitochondrial outer membrane protein porin [Yarrowia sp. C11]